MKQNKKYLKPILTSKVKEKDEEYGRIHITSFEAQEQEDIEFTKNMSYEERFALLQKLREITHGVQNNDSKNNVFDGKLKIRKSNENI